MHNKTDITLASVPQVNKLHHEGVKLPELPADICRYGIAAYLDYSSLLAYAFIDKRHLILLLPELEHRLISPLRLVASSYHNYILAGSEIYVSGVNNGGELGLELKRYEKTYFFAAVTGHEGTIQQAIFESQRTFILTKQGLYVCGVNSHGQLGLGNKIQSQNKLLKHPGITGNIRQIATTSDGSNAFILTNKGVYAWGSNQGGQLGLGDRNRRTCPTLVQGISGTPQQIISHNRQTFIITETQVYACYAHGSNAFIEIERFPGVIQQVITGAHHSYILANTGLYACGANKNGQLGLGNNENADEKKGFSKVIDIPGTLQQIVVGDFHTFIVTSSGLYACGLNREGQLGLGHTRNRSSFTEVKNVSGNIQQVVLGDYHSFVLTDRGLYACGQNRDGRLGIKGRAIVNSFVQITGFKGTAQQVATAKDCSFVLTDVGLYACGNNKYGQLGIGQTEEENIYAFTPVKTIPAVVKYEWQNYQRYKKMIKFGQALQSQGFFNIKSTSPSPVNDLPIIIGPQEERDNANIKQVL